MKAGREYMNYVIVQRKVNSLVVTTKQYLPINAYVVKLRVTVGIDNSILIGCLLVCVLANILRM